MEGYIKQHVECLCLMLWVCAVAASLALRYVSCHHIGRYGAFKRKKDPYLLSKWDEVEC
jgi:hypothetical protein